MELIKVIKALASLRYAFCYAKEATNKKAFRYTERPVLYFPCQLFNLSTCQLLTYLQQIFHQLNKFVLNRIHRQLRIILHAHFFKYARAIGADGIYT